MNTNKPKIFISSTIYDFSDLRSAIKFYLESIGFEVYMSDYNDFPIDFDKNSYEECLKTIEKVQYFILLIGSRVGGFYDKEKKISITEKEYQKAYELLKEGKLKIINIVRENIWLARNERKELAKLLEEEFVKKNELTYDDFKKIINYKSNIANDAEYTFNFINNVAKVEEMKEAQIGNVSFPKGNWIHTFKNFEDIIEILKRLNINSDGLELIALKENIKYELINNWKYFYLKDKGKIFFKANSVNDLASRYNGELNGQTTINNKDFKLLKFYSIMGIGFSTFLKTDFIDNALKTGKFLKYDFENGKYIQSSFSFALLKYREFIERLKRLEEIENFSLNNRLEFFNKFKDKNDEYHINNVLIYSYLSIYNLQKKIDNLSLAIYFYIFGIETLLIDFNYEEYGPSKDISEELKTEDISEVDFVKFISELFDEIKKDINSP